MILWKFFNSSNLKRLICVLSKNGKKRELEDVLNKLFENYQYDKDYEFDEIIEQLTTPLHIGCYYEDIEIIKLLIHYGANVNIKNNKQ
ncbi:hypothetical protein BCR32DRAFT_282480 [Anaeromyces robustus]|uniref:Uncharacterized protein n=1 Tax=Anaeromyces robustus TaxID=1754192 RepID=A0A1Y1WXB9_9FUNG|nr:hypothetical protein BCR32DRAFT_282480 [Anaeromyces robustus]|eukprot:ORX78207.1 hypothetical protein BCR32DRAFT_282480 [Anaeromyces robustus]